MRKLSLLFAGLCVAGVTIGASAVEAHSVRQCQREIKLFTRLCKLHLTSRILGACDTKQTYKWCSDPKKHKKELHK